MILSDSIIETIKNSKVFVFIKNSRTVLDDRTVSPWVYLENKIANNMPKTEIKHSFFEDSNVGPKISFKIDTRGYYIANSANDINHLVRRTLHE